MNEHGKYKSEKELFFFKISFRHLHNQKSEKSNLVDFNGRYCFSVADPRFIEFFDRQLLLPMLCMFRNETGLEEN